jgi:fibro-slime domain-containing protein
MWAQAYASGQRARNKLAGLPTLPGWHVFPVQSHLRGRSNMRASYIALAILLVAACAESGSTSGTLPGGRSGGSAEPTGGAAGGAGGEAGGGAEGGGGYDAAIGQRPPPAGCGNGERTKNEACDDGNMKDGDGCSADCLKIEEGFSCFPAGQACRVVARCGDGIIASSELCDDGNTKDGDGCSAKCKFEIGFKCSGEPSKCDPTTCGDKKAEGAEACDDGNELPFDGCSASCQAEPSCTQGSACASKCGDGLALNEACDDGNLKDGDGCSSKCTVEAGFMCTTSASCQRQGDKCILRVPVIYRDFQDAHPDFGIGCGQLTKGIAAPMLNSMGKPTLASSQNACIQSAATYAEWYTASPNNVSIPGELVLYEDGMGGFVNRYGAMGEKFAGVPLFSNIVYGGQAGMGCMMCTPSAQGKCYDPCTPQNALGNACCADAQERLFDGTPLFFPIDNDPRAFKDTRLRAKVPEQYGYLGWPYEDVVFPGAKTHNFLFTTEVVYWFAYNADTNATLTFNGDDDVWVFVNGKLAVDLGGAHVPQPGSVTIDAASANTYGLKAGSVYEIRVFHAERKPEGSSFRLTLSGFNTARSECTPICGDGIVTLGEECDDGKNDGGYEECAPGCVLGPSCGDGIVQEGEDCDDGNRRDGDKCGSSCRNLDLF